MTLDALEHALGYTLTINEDGDPVSSGAAEYSIYDLLDFMAGCTGDEGVVKVSENVYDDYRPHYTHNSVIRALIAEVRRLRELEAARGESSNVG